MRYAEKFNNAGEARIHLVWEEWFWDSLDFGGTLGRDFGQSGDLTYPSGRFGEATYAVSSPRPERKTAPADLVSALPQPSSAPLSSSPVAISGRLDQPAHGLHGPITPLNLPGGASVTEDDESEVVSVRRPASETLQVWESLLRPRGFALVDGRLARSPSKASSQPAGERSTSPCPAPRILRPAISLRDGAAAGLKASALAGFSRAHSFAPASKDVSTPKQLFRRGPSKSAAHAGNSSFLGGMKEAAETDPVNVGLDASEQPQALLQGVETAEPHRTGVADPSRPRVTFSGLRFMALGEAQSDAVRAAVEGAGGEMAQGVNAQADFIIVRLVR
jgi:DNA replication regulator DPB11